MIKSQTTRVLFVIALCVGTLAVWRGRPILPGQGLFARPATAASNALPVPIVTMCGPIIEFQAPTASATGVLNIGGTSLTLAAGASINGFAVGTNVCATLCSNENGQVVNVISDISNNAGGISMVCGIVTEYSTYSNKLSIGGSHFQLEPYLTINGGSLIAPGANLCLYPVYRADGKLTTGTTVTLAPGALGIRIPALTHGKTLDADFKEAEDGVFRLPSSFILNVQAPVPSGVEVKQAAADGMYRTPFGVFDARDLVRFSSSSSNSTVRATSCSDSLWDMFVQLETSGSTEGDMVTLAVQNPDGSNVQVLAMFTIQGGNAVVTQIHPHVSLRWDGGNLSVGRLIPFNPANDVWRTATLTMVFQMNSSLLSGCLQYFTEIKRAGGAGTTSVIHIAAVLKRMENSSGDKAEGYDLSTGALGSFPTGLVCAVSCNSCLPPPPTPTPSLPSSPTPTPTPSPSPLPGSLSGYVYCDTNNDGDFQQGSESGIANVTVTLSGFDLNGAVNRVTTTNSAGFYIFPDLMPGIYQIVETQPPGTTDGIDKAGNLGGDATSVNDRITNIPLPALGIGQNYNFGEICATSTPTPTPTPSPSPMMPKCDTLCWRDTAWFLRNPNQWPSGVVLAMGFNTNNSVSLQGNANTVRIILNSGTSPVQRFNREFVTAQMSILKAGGPSSPVVFNVLWSQLRCSGIQFAPVTLSNGVILSPDSLLDTLMSQSVLSIRENRQGDMDELASIWAQLNGQCNLY